MHALRLLILSCLFWLCSIPVFSMAHAAEPELLLPKTRLDARDLAVIVNRNDALSVRIGRYYVERRGIPPENLIEVDFSNNGPTLSEAQFREVYAQVGAKLPAHIQAFALAWMLPYKAGCMSITSAFATGYDKRYCPAKKCAPTQQSPYFNSPSQHPFRDHGIRPAMLLAARNFREAKALIDRGVAADKTQPAGTAYLLSTSDKHRNVRSGGYSPARDLFGNALTTHIIHADALRERDDVLFYFTGLISVDDIDSNRYLPGAIADHLTSAGGVLEGSKQMTSMRWLEAGATGSYGTVVEPCNFQQKFPIPGLVIQNYLGGETLIESYWKSVAWPAEGVFIGEPLAAPFAGDRIEYTRNEILLSSYSLYPGEYVVTGSLSPIGPFTPIGRIASQGPGLKTHRIPVRGHPYISIQPVLPGTANMRTSHP